MAITFFRFLSGLSRRDPPELKSPESGKPWSPNLADLDEFLTSGKSVEKIAEYLCRDVEEVEAKIAEMCNRCRSAYASPPAARVR
jgi:hypothetical protein